MSKQGYQVELPASSERVWAFVTAVGFWRIWIGSVSAIKSISTPIIQAGTTFEVQHGGQHHVEHWIVAEWEAGRKVRFAEYHRDIQLLLEVTPAGNDTTLDMEVAWPTPRGALGFLMKGTTSGGRWARGLASAPGSLRELFIYNRDIKLLHGMGDE